MLPHGVGVDWAVGPTGRSRWPERRRRRRSRRCSHQTFWPRLEPGDHRAFAELILPHQLELELHCYRMLGSRQDAEDALQETLLAAWHGLAIFEERASLRTWLYRIATNRCLDARRRARRRPAKAWDVPGVALLEPSGREDVVWLEPYPDSRLPATRGPTRPGARYDQLESISLAFVTALQLLPPRQLAVVVLREVLGFPAREVAAMLDTTVESVTSALRPRPSQPAATRALR